MLNIFNWLGMCTAAMSVVKILSIPQKARKFPAIWVTTGFSRRTCFIMVDKAKTSFRTWDQTEQPRTRRSLVLDWWRSVISALHVEQSLAICRFTVNSLFHFFANLDMFFSSWFLCTYTWKTMVASTPSDPHMLGPSLQWHLNPIIFFLFCHCDVMYTSKFCALFLMCFCLDLKTCFW
jgi:hypothetical protein